MNRPWIARLSALVAVIASVGVVATAAPAAPTHVTAATVKVTATEFKFALSTKTVKAGVVKFTLVNHGKLPHDFKIAGKKTAQIGPGKTSTVSVTLKAGPHPYVCTVPGHAAAGMKGVVVAK